MGCPALVNSFRHGRLRPFAPVAWGCVSPIDWCPRRSVIRHRANAECTLRCLRCPPRPIQRIGRGGFSCDACPWVMCPRVRVPLFSMILVRHVIRIQRGDESGCRGRYHRCFAVVLCCLDVVNVVPKLDSQLCTPRAATAYVSWSFVNVSVLPGSGCVAPVAGLPVIAGPA